MLNLVDFVENRMLLIHHKTHDVQRLKM